MSVGHDRSFGDVGSMSGLRESGHGWAIYEYRSLGWHTDPVWSGSDLKPPPGPEIANRLMDAPPL